MPATPSIAYVIEPRFPGGTSSAVANELRATARMAPVSVNAISSEMFKGGTIAPYLKAALQNLNIEMTWDPQSISANIVIIHNPSFLKFQKQLGTRIVANHIIVVAHENFLRPGGAEAFDVTSCLGAIDRASVALTKSIAPVSPYNRKTITEWMESNHFSDRWTLLNRDWLNICDFPIAPPNQHPNDRRGRHSRAGFEKFPNIRDMDLCFPSHAQSNVILGADTFISDAIQRPHWEMIPFRGMSVSDYFEKIDFMVYFTSPAWRESFGRVIAESIAAGKIVITDPGTASVFSGATVPAAPQDVDDIVRMFVAEPRRYVDFVTLAQGKLAEFSESSFQLRFSEYLHNFLGVRK